MKQVVKNILVLLAWAAAVLAPLSMEGAEDKVCAGKGGTCGCSQGRVVCCDGSYAPKHSWSGGRLVTAECSTPVNLNGKATYRRRPAPQTPDVTRPGVIPPSHEGFWKRSVFDR